MLNKLTALPKNTQNTTVYSPQLGGAALLEEEEMARIVRRPKEWGPEELDVEELGLKEEREDSLIQELLFEFLS